MRMRIILGEEQDGQCGIGVYLILEVLYVKPMAHDSGQSVNQSISRSTNQLIS